MNTDQFGNTISKNSSLNEKFVSLAELSTQGLEYEEFTEIITDQYGNTINKLNRGRSNSAKSRNEKPTTQGLDYEEFTEIVINQYGNTITKAKKGPTMGGSKKATASAPEATTEDSLFEDETEYITETRQPRPTKVPITKAEKKRTKPPSIETTTEDIFYEDITEILTETRAPPTKRKQVVRINNNKSEAMMARVKNLSKNAYEKNKKTSKSALKATTLQHNNGLTKTTLKPTTLASDVTFMEIESQTDFYTKLPTITKGRKDIPLEIRQQHLLTGELRCLKTFIMTTVNPFQP